MRLYLDSNIYRQIRPGSKHMNQELLNAVEKLKDVFLFVFSDAHLNDLSNSEEIYREIDLAHMAEYVKNNYFHHDHIERTDKISLATPKEAYSSIDFEVSRKILEDPNGFIEEAFGMEELSSLQPMFKQLLDMPLFDTAKKDPILSNSLETLGLGQEFSGISTIRDALKGLNQAGGFISDKESFAKHQQFLRSYVDRKEYSYEVWSFDFDERMKETAFGKSFSELVDIVSTSAGPEDDYNRFINTYVQLEFLGVTEERSGGKRKKNSYMDLQRDAAHAYFATMTDYFVSDDKGVQTKAFIAYKIFGIATQVLTVKDFIAKSPFLLNNEEDLNSFATGIKYSLKHGFVIHHSLMSNQQVIKLPYPVLNYFDRLQSSISNAGKSYLLLFRSARGRRHGVMYAEFNLLLNKCIKLLGLPKDYKNRLDLTEFKELEDNETQRTWSLGSSSATLSFGDTSDGFRTITLEITA